jgi:hypothetical protein
MSSDGIQHENQLRHLLFSETARVSDLLSEVKRMKFFDPDVDLRALACDSLGGIKEILDGDKMLGRCKNPFRIEMIPRDQEDVDLCPVVIHQGRRNPSLSFVLKVIPSEVMADTRLRIAEMVSQFISSESLMLYKCKIRKIGFNGYAQDSDLSDSTELDECYDPWHSILVMSPRSTTIRRMPMRNPTNRVSKESTSAVIKLFN